MWIISPSYNSEVEHLMQICALKQLVIFPISAASQLLAVSR